MRWAKGRNEFHAHFAEYVYLRRYGRDEEALACLRMATQFGIAPDPLTEYWDWEFDLESYLHKAALHAAINGDMDTASKLLETCKQRFQCDDREVRERVLSLRGADMATIEREKKRVINDALQFEVFQGYE